MKTCETRVRITTKAMRLISLAASCLIAHGAYAAEIQWNSSHGGDMQVETNWRNNTKPTSSDTIKIALNNDKPITLSEDLTATGDGTTYISHLNASYELALTNSAGVAKTLSLKRIHLGGGSKTVRLTAGVLSFSNQLYMGDWGRDYRDDTLIVDGATLSGGNSDIQVGTGYPGHTFVATNGATISGRSLSSGRNAQKLNGYYSTNELVRITGGNTTGTFTGGLFTGCGGGNRIEIDNGANVVANYMRVGSSNFSNSNTAFDPENEPSFAGKSAITVSNGSTLVLTNSAANKSVIGMDSMSNLLEVVNGSHLIVITNQLIVGGQDYLSGFAAKYPGYVYSGNRLRIAGEGSSALLRCGANSGLWIGTKLAPDCSVTVEDKATWESHGDLKIGDGSVTNATFRVASGASVTHHIYSFNIGTSADAVNSALEIDDGTVASDTTINVVGIGSHISFKSADSRLSTANTLDFRANTRFDVEIPAGGFTGGVAPVTCSTLSLNAAAAVNVALGDGWKDVASGNYRIVIAEATNDISETGFTLNLPDTDKFVVTRDTTNAKQLAVNVKVKGGLIIIFR